MLVLFEKKSTRITQGFSLFPSFCYLHKCPLSTLKKSYLSNYMVSKFYSHFLNHICPLNNYVWSIDHVFRGLIRYIWKIRKFQGRFGFFSQKVFFTSCFANVGNNRNLESRWNPSCIQSFWWQEFESTFESGSRCLLSPYSRCRWVFDTSKWWIMEGKTFYPSLLILNPFRKSMKTSMLFMLCCNWRKCLWLLSIGSNKPRGCWTCSTNQGFTCSC